MVVVSHLVKKNSKPLLFLEPYIVRSTEPSGIAELKHLSAIPDDV
jgi:hypothetical protein